MIMESERGEDNMERHGERFISPNFTREDFLNIQLTISSDEEDWNQAIHIMDNRIRGRFFDSINILIDNINENGFAIMALNCLLVETLYQFTRGLGETELGKNKDRYVAFLNLVMPGVFPNRKSREVFYSDIRCGILHSAQTKRGSQLTFDKPYVIEMFGNEQIRVDVKEFTRHLVDYYNKYMYDLSKPENITLRLAFINKMTLICMADEI